MNGPTSAGLAPADDHAFADAEARFLRLLRSPDLDAEVARDPREARALERDVARAERAAFERDDPRAHRFLHRVLYRINRMKLFWYDALENYDNERSAYLHALRARIEASWQAWERRQDDDDEASAGASAALRARAARDLDPAPGDGGRYFRDACGIAGYRRLLEIFSLDALVEASQLSRTLGGATNEVHLVMTKLFLEEYGNGKASRKHSTFFAAMLEELDMDATPERYFDSTPWEVLATINHSFLLSERKRYYLRYVGGLLYTEVSTPAGFACYRAAAARLGLHGEGTDYWQLHIREDERHGRWMLDEVALPLARRYRERASELVLGYDQQRRMSARAGASLAREARAADAAVPLAKSDAA